MCTSGEAFSEHKRMRTLKLKLREAERDIRQLKAMLRLPKGMLGIQSNGPEEGSEVQCIRKGRQSNNQKGVLGAVLACLCTNSGVRIDRHQN